MKSNEFVDWGWGLTALLGGSAILLALYVTPETGGLGKRVVPIVASVVMIIQGLYLLRRSYRRRGALNEARHEGVTEGSEELED